MLSAARTDLRMVKSQQCVACAHCQAFSRLHALTTMKDSSFFRCSGVVSGSDATSKHLHNTSSVTSTAAC